MKVFSTNRIIIGIPVLILTCILILSQTVLIYQPKSRLSNAILLDLLLTLPAVYFMLIRKRKDIPKITVLTLFILCLFIVGRIIPLEHQSSLDFIYPFIIPLIELIVFSFIIYKTIKVIQTFSKESNHNRDFYDALKIASNSVFPSRIGDLLATEIAVFYYLFKPRIKRKLLQNEFTYYKHSGVQLTIAVFLGLLVFETIAIHIFAERLSLTLAWILSGISIYTFLQIIALLRSMPIRRIEINVSDNRLVLRYGFFSESTINISEIIAIEASRKSLPDDNSIVQFSPLGPLDTHNIIIHLKTINVVYRPYGIKKEYASLALYVDDKERFLDQLHEIKNGSTNTCDSDVKG